MLILLRVKYAIFLHMACFAFWGEMFNNNDNLNVLAPTAKV